MKSMESAKAAEMITSSLLPFITKELSKLTPQELDSLQELNKLESQAKIIAEVARGDLTQLRSHAISAIDPQIDRLNLSPRESALVKALYQETLLDPMEDAIKKLKISDALYSKILCETSANILEGILNFKKSFEENFPITNAFMQILAPVATTLISIYFPPVSIGIALSSGLLEKAASFFSNENLENTVKKMRHDLAEIKKDKELAATYEAGERMSKLSTKTKIPSSSLGKLGLHAKDMLYATTEVATNIAAGRMLKSVCDFADQHLPVNHEQIAATFQKVKAETRANLQKLGIPESELDLSEAILNEAIDSAKAEMAQVLDPRSKIFDKMAAIQRSAEIMDKAANNIGAELSKELPNGAKIKSTVISTVKKEVQKTLRGKLSDIAKQLTGRGGAKDFAKKALGSNLASEMTLKRAATQAKQLTRGA